MPYDKDLRDLLKATKKACRPIPETVEERVQKMHDVVSSMRPSDKKGNEQKRAS